MERILAVAGRKQNVSDLVLVEDFVRLVLKRIRTHQIKIVLQHASVFENINSAIDEILNLGIMPAQVASPQVEVQDISLRRMSLQIRNNARRISLLDRGANLRLARPIVCHRRKQRQEHNNVYSWSLKLGSVRREEIQQLRQQRGDYDSQKHQKPDIGQPAVA